MTEAPIGKLFFELIQIALHRREDFECPPSARQWPILYRLAVKQALVGVLYPAVERTLSLHPLQERRPQWLIDWVGSRMGIEHENERLNGRARDITELFTSLGVRSCVLKGQGVALLYPDPLLRQPGDIDLWVEGKRADTERLLRQRWKVGEEVYHHFDVEIYDDTETEIHVIPSWLYNPFANARMQRFYHQQAEHQFTHAAQRLAGDGACDAMGFNVPTLVFNLVFSLSHIWHHFFDEGVGFRQLMDYYYLLMHSTEEERVEAMKVLRSLNMAGFAGAVMFILERGFGLDEEHRLCPSDCWRGGILLEEIATGGNFGQYRSKGGASATEGPLRRGWRKTRRQLRFLRAFPCEVPWIPLWKCWHYLWRRHHGYHIH